MLDFQYEIVKVPTYRAVGLKWDGPWAEISNLKIVIHSSDLNDPHFDILIPIVKKK